MLYAVWKDSVTKERWFFFLFKKIILYFFPYTFLHNSEPGNHILISISAEKAFDKIYQLFMIKNED